MIAFARFPFARFLVVCLGVAGSLLANQDSETNRALSVSWQPVGAVEVRSAEDVIAKWKPNQHLYVKGDLGISKPQLAKLEKWLDENGPHWTIVLMREAQRRNLPLFGPADVLRNGCSGICVGTRIGESN